jgi:GT2 family glycosyltransferase
MFSILICSVNTAYLEKIKINLRETVTQEYELLVWDNRLESKPITEVYNLLASRAKYPYWCFIHEDIKFETDNWANNLLAAFDQYPDIGLIGIAGSKYKSHGPSGWSTGIPDYDCCNIFHQDKNGKTIHLYNNPNQSVVEQVVNVDGVFIAIRREVWSTTQFNSTLLHDFHCYDIDFSFHIFKSWKIGVLFNINILHYTQGGNYGDKWVKDTLKWHRNFSSQLPQFLIKNHEQFANLENKITRNWLYRLRTENISIENKIKWVLFSKSIWHPRTWPYIGLFLIGKILKGKQSN